MCIIDRAKIIYNYALGKPEKVYKDGSLDKALGEGRKAIAIDERPFYVQLEGDIQFAKQDLSLIHIFGKILELSCSETRHAIRPVLQAVCPAIPIDV